MTTTPRLELLAPQLLTTDKNVRKDLNLTKPFLDSIRTNGVLEPIVAYPDPINDGCYRVHLGHRRTAAAIEGKVATVPVYIIDPREAEARVAEQLVENMHRQELTPAEVAGGYLEMSLFGQSAMAIAKSTSTKLAVVGDAIRVAKAPAATQAMATYQLSIDEALAFVEFEGDEASIAELTETAERNPAQISHRVQRLRDARAEEAARQTIIEEIRATGITLLEAKPDYYDNTLRILGALFTGPKLTTTITEETALAEAGTDLRAYPEKVYGEWSGDTRQPNSYTIGYAVANWADHGWHAHDRGGSNTPAKGPLTDAEKDERRQARENASTWASATTVRLTWLTEHLQIKTLQNGATALAAAYFATLPNDYGSKVELLAHTLLGAERITATSSWGSTSHTSVLPELVRATPTRAGHVLLAIAAAGIESSLDEKKGWSSTSVLLPVYLRQLAAWGYTLSELEENLTVEAVAV